MCDRLLSVQYFRPEPFRILSGNVPRYVENRFVWARMNFRYAGDWTARKADKPYGRFFWPVAHCGLSAASTHKLAFTSKYHIVSQARPNLTVLFRKMAYRGKHIKSTREFWKSPTNLSSLSSIGGECNTR